MLGVGLCPTCSVGLGLTCSVGLGPTCSLGLTCSVGLGQTCSVGLGLMCSVGLCPTCSVGLCPICSVGLGLSCSVGLCLTCSLGLMCNVGLGSTCKRPTIRGRRKNMKEATASYQNWQKQLQQVKHASTHHLPIKQKHERMAAGEEDEQVICKVTEDKRSGNNLVLECWKTVVSRRSQDAISSRRRSQDAPAGEGHRMLSPAGAAEEFSSPSVHGQLSVLTLVFILAFLTPWCYCSCMQKIPVILPKVQGTVSWHH